MHAFKSPLVRVSSLLFAVLVLTTTLAQGQPRHHGQRDLGQIAPLAALLLSPDVHAALGLSATQEAQWSALQAAEQSLRAFREAARTNLEALFAVEFADVIPDLVAIEDAVMAEHEAAAAAMAVISNQAIALYSGLNTGQQTIVIAKVRAQ